MPTPSPLPPVDPVSISTDGKLLTILFFDCTFSRAKYIVGTDLRVGKILVCLIVLPRLVQIMVIL